MRETGWLLICLGVIAAVVGAALDDTVSTSYLGGASHMPGGGYLPPMPSSVANLQKMHIQALVIQGGFVAILCGTMLAAAAAIVDAMRGRDEKPLAQVVQASTASEAAENDGGLGWIVPVFAGAFLVLLVVVLVAYGGKQSPRMSSDNVLMEAQNALDQANATIAEIDAAAAEASNAANAATTETRRTGR